MKLIKKRDLTPDGTKQTLNGVLGSAIDRRTFLRRTGLALGGGAVAGALPPAMMRRAEAAGGAAGGNTEIKKSVCTHCSVGCGVVAEVQNGVWTGQEPDFDSPFNMGGHWDHQSQHRCRPVLSKAKPFPALPRGTAGSPRHPGELQL